ncbi:ataxin-7-like protein 2a isoform X2 [Denticeps clupeoides]|uniref:ataxin-7-like protein 2a isoform X2 n=1 Tax=Denticeps clupeoides TaxID=299321 RepID=UPI0010A3B2CE|nr:ataxin-7-like protein 2 isoform X2 [Denticeps clupeoides]
MMAVRERATAVMAALDRRLPGLDDFVGQNWSAWAERAGANAVDGTDSDDCGKNGKKAVEAMILRKEDMSIFGHYPGHDDFYLVVCSHCSQVVKPQAFEKHCERRHGPLGKLYAHLRSPPLPSQQRSRHGAAPSHVPASWSGKSQGAGPTRTAPQSPTTPSQHRHTKAPKEGVRLSPHEKSPHSAHSESLVFKQPPPLDPPRSSTPPNLRDPPWPSGGTMSSRPASAEKPLAQRGEQGVGNRGPKTYKVVSKKVFDLDKHCGVMDPERKKVCTRLLTCNIHSVHQRRKVQGRSKNFNQLVAELKMSSRARERVASAPDGPATPASLPEGTRDSTAPVPHCRRPLTDSPAFRSRQSSESAYEEEKPAQDEGLARPLSPATLGRVSSEESDGEGAEELAEWHATPWHPRPLAVCTFGGRTMGHGIFTFDRRLHNLRSAVSAMVEQHLNAHLWKKIPQVTDLQSQSPSSKPSASSSSSMSQYSKARTGSHGATSPRTASHSQQLPLSSASKPHSQSENSRGATPIVTSPVPARSSTQSGPGRPRNPVGRTNKQQLRLKEAERAAAALRKRKASFGDADPTSPDRNCVPSDRGRPPPSAKPSPSSSAASPHGQTNGSLSPGSKPRPQLAPADPHAPSSWAFKRAHSSPSDASPHRGGDSGLHGRAASLDHKGLGKKCKSSASPPSKPHRVPSSPHSGFYPWKESKGVGLSVGGEKKLGTPKPKLHH